MSRVKARPASAALGTDRMKGKADEIVKWVTQPQRRPKILDDWAACRAEKLEDLRDLFIPNFYYGCEADDPMVAWAFNSKVNPMGVKLKAMMSSDIGHWDVTDMNEVVEEAHELVDDGLITEEDFRDYTFVNAATPLRRHESRFFQRHGLRGSSGEAAAERFIGCKAGGFGMTPMRWTTQEKWGERTNDSVQLYYRLIMREAR